MRRFNDDKHGLGGICYVNSICYACPVYLLLHAAAGPGNLKSERILIKSIPEA
jgi:hypothetical protein